MKDCEDREGRIQDEGDLKGEEKGLSSRIIPHEVDYTVKPEDDRHHRPYIFSDHLQLLVSPVKVAYPHIIERPQEGEQEGDKHGDEGDQKKTAELEVAFGDEER